MQKFVIVPDSFKGTLSSKQICDIFEERIFAHFPSANVVCVPVADGGEGSVDCFLSAMKGEKIVCETVNPFFEKMQGFYAILDGGKTAIVEMAVCAGLPLIEERKNPMLATTYGVGLLIKDALQKGVKEIVLALGGSATNDFGCGLAAALGVRFFNQDGESFIPVGGTLNEIAKIQTDEICKLLKDVKMTVMCDVKNPVFGKDGAAYVYAPQKGATKRQVELLDEGLRHVCDVVLRDLKVDVSTLVGGGAAGATAGGVYAFFGASLRMGIDVVLDTVGFDNLLENADVVFTGEGKLDGQSLQGKVVVGVARRAKQQGVPVIAVVGGVEGDTSAIYQEGLTAVFTINRMPEDFSISRFKSEENLKHTIDNLLRALQYNKRA